MLISKFSPAINLTPPILHGVRMSLALYFAAFCCRRFVSLTVIFPSQVIHHGAMVWLWLKLQPALDLKPALSTDVLTHSAYCGPFSPESREMPEGENGVTERFTDDRYCNTEALLFYFYRQRPRTWGMQTPTHKYFSVQTNIYVRRCFCVTATQKQT